ncbi:hypothetical protein Arub01_41140 [Actinomadura rubrobrunea]|uniref:Helix-turn-helix domain-containing protein n=1 Tax=Actinomadura rubrobrunea TaxID=115335 RepID=A0A9W6UYM7_9ACTN|nr:hypothetical protein Arub01_41140 [Actinomadura rubrobrunea]
MTHAPPSPRHARSVAEYVAFACRLKAWSGLSYRELARRAARNGDHLAPSTLATALGRESLPSEALMAAFVRACGCDQETVDEWIGARRRIAMAAVGGPAPAPPEETARSAARGAAEAADPVRASRHGRISPRTRILAVAAVIVAGAAGSVPEVQARTGQRPERAVTAAAATFDADTGPLTPGWYRVHVGNGRCLSVREDGPRRVVTREKCAAVARQRFHFTHAGRYFHIRATGSECLALEPDAPANPLRLRACSTSDPDQWLLIDAVSRTRRSWLPTRLTLRATGGPGCCASTGSPPPRGRARTAAHRADLSFYLTAEE